MLKRHYDPKSGLYRQVWNETTRSFERADLWGGGQGWMAGALALACRFLPQEQKEYCGELSGLLNHLISSMENYLREDGMFHDVMDDPKTFPEVTAGLMPAVILPRHRLFLCYVLRKKKNWNGD